MGLIEWLFFKKKNKKQSDATSFMWTTYVDISYSYINVQIVYS